MSNQKKSLIFMMCKPLFVEHLDKILDICNEIGNKFDINPLELMLVFSMDVLKTSVLAGYEVGLNVDMHAYADAVIGVLEEHIKEKEKES